MELIPVTTRIMHPPQDDLLAVLDASLSEVLEGDVVVVSSKVVSIHEGRCLDKDGIDKARLVQAEAEVVLDRPYAQKPLTITHAAFISAAGIDESNGDGYYVLLPEDPFRSAAGIHAYLTKRFGLQQVGVIVTDSHSMPLRFGALGIGIGFWGIAPLESHVGKHDLFGREFKHERTNVIDSIAAGANLVMGETNECRPVVIARHVPDLHFTTGDQRAALFASFTDDTFRVLYDRWVS